MLPANNQNDDATMAAIALIANSQRSEAAKVADVQPHLFSLPATLPDWHEREKLEEMLAWSGRGITYPSLWLTQVRAICARVNQATFRRPSRTWGVMPRAGMDDRPGFRRRRDHAQGWRSSPRIEP